MLVCSVTSLEEARKAFAFAEAVELRLDLFSIIDLFALESFLKESPIPTLFTLRSKAHGGFFTQTEEKRKELIGKLFSLKPTFFDLEYDIDKDFLHIISGRYPEVKIVGSFHDFVQTPENLEDIIKNMLSSSFYAYKIATTAVSSLDALRMLAFVKKQNALDRKIAGVCMGQKGQFSRALGKIYGSFFSYSSLEGNPYWAPGQISLSDMRNVYRYKSMSPSSSVYALLGGSTSQSLSHFTHNRVMQELSLDAIYVKIDLLEEELPVFFAYVRELGFKGMSVTMPLKQAVLFFLQETEREAGEMGAVNTLCIRDGKIKGFNTDGKGALDAIEKHIPVEGKKVAILGAGGAAKSIAYTAKKRGGVVSVFNRTLNKAESLAKELHIAYGSLQDLEKADYDILVNCTPDPRPIIPEWILKQIAYMDCKTLSRKGSLYEEVLRKKGTAVYGYEMFINQAILQEKIWFPETEERDIREKITEEVLSRIATENI